MTNPFSGFEHAQYAEDHLPRSESIQPAGAEVVKTLLEVYRDTANKSDASEILLSKAQDKIASLEYQMEIQEENYEGLKSQRLEDIKARDQIIEREVEHSAKLREHRERLADIVGAVRVTKTIMSEEVDRLKEGGYEPSLGWLVSIVETLERDLGEES